MSTALRAITIPGNLHDVVKFANAQELAEHLVGWERAGNYTVVVFRLSASELARRDNDLRITPQ